VKVIKLVVLQS